MSATEFKFHWSLVKHMMRTVHYFDLRYEQQVKRLATLSYLGLTRVVEDAFKSILCLRVGRLYSSTVDSVQ
jgi:hypothetical protein